MMMLKALESSEGTGRRWRRIDNINPHGNTATIDRLIWWDNKCKWLLITQPMSPPDHNDNDYDDDDDNNDDYDDK